MPWAVLRSDHVTRSVMDSLESDDALNEPRVLAQRNPTIWPREAERHSISKINDSPATEHIVGASAAWRNVLKRAAQVAPTETTVCVHGESGTGKEVVAR